VEVFFSLVAVLFDLELSLLYCCVYCILMKLCLGCLFLYPFNVSFYFSLSTCGGLLSNKGFEQYVLQLCSKIYHLLTADYVLLCYAMEIVLDLKPM